MKKKAKRRLDVDRPYADGQWTKARFISFVKSALRGARWPCKYECIKKAYVKDGVNPKTGKKCKLHLCPQCGEMLPQSSMQADHVIDVVGPEGFVDWNTYIERLFVDSNGFTAICKDCHKRITNHAKEIRKQYKHEHGIS